MIGRWSPLNLTLCCSSLFYSSRIIVICTIYFELLIHITVKYVHPYNIRIRLHVPCMYKYIDSHKLQFFAPSKQTHMRRSSWIFLGYAMLSVCPLLEDNEVFCSVLLSAIITIEARRSEKRKASTTSTSTQAKAASLSSSQAGAGIEVAVDWDLFPYDTSLEGDDGGWRVDYQDSIVCHQPNRYTHTIPYHIIYHTVSLTL
jgi:hypothetical protein